MILPLIPAVVALILVPMARRDIAASGGRLNHGGLLTWATILAILNLVGCVAVVTVIAVVVSHRQTVDTLNSTVFLVR